MELGLVVVAAVALTVCEQLRRQSTGQLMECGGPHTNRGLTQASNKAL